MGTHKNDRTHAGPVQRRDLHFDITPDLPRHWYDNDPFITSYFNGLSLMFPDGERFFIDSVRHYRDRITEPQLKEQVHGFIGQEAMHGREHAQYNRTLEAQGYDVKPLELSLREDLAFAQENLNPRHQLSITCALEHFTAIMADVALRDYHLFDEADPRYAALWRWHAVEETEHKAVAFDVYRTVAPGWRGYLRRVVTMFFTTLHFETRIAHHVLHLVRRDGRLWDIRGWLRLFRFLWVKPGLMRRRIPKYLAYYRPGFHPWQHDNRQLVDGWKAEFERESSPTC